MKAELHQTESEIHKLKEVIEKQERDRLDIKQRISSGFDQQIQDFEEAIMSIEEQKLGIYNKLNEAVAVHNQVRFVLFGDSKVTQNDRILSKKR